MAKKLTSFLPQLSVAVPIVTTGLLIFQEIPDPITSLLSKTSDEQKEEGEKSKEGKEGAKGDKKGEDGVTGKGQGQQEGDGKGDLEFTAKKGEQGLGGTGEGKGQFPVDGIKTLEFGRGTSEAIGTNTMNALGNEDLSGIDVLKSAEGLLNTLKQGTPEAGKEDGQGPQIGQQGESIESTDSMGRDNSNGNLSQGVADNVLSVGAGEGSETRETTGIPSTSGGRGWASVFSGFWGGELTEEFID